MSADGGRRYKIAHPDKVSAMTRYQYWRRKLGRKLAKELTPFLEMRYELKKELRKDLKGVE
jgi:rRNA maturation protein Nop10